MVRIADGQIYIELAPHSCGLFPKMYPRSARKSCQRVLHVHTNVIWYSLSVLYHLHHLLCVRESRFTRLLDSTLMYLCFYVCHQLPDRFIIRHVVRWTQEIMVLARKAKIWASSILALPYTV